MLRVTLKKISDNPNRLRTNEVYGKCTHVPEVGYSFQMFSESLDPQVKEAGGFRVVTTSMVQTVGYFPDKKLFTFKTLNSLYELTVLDEDKNPEDYRRWQPATRVA